MPRDRIMSFRCTFFAMSSHSARGASEQEGGVNSDCAYPHSREYVLDTVIQAVRLSSDLHTLHSEEGVLMTEQDCA
jgi:hypothetical protein